VQRHDRLRVDGRSTVWVPSPPGASVHGHQVKLERARALLNELQREADAYIDACENAIVHQPLPDQRTHRYVAEGIEPLPRLAALAGDIVHNTRTALDNLAWAIARKCGSASDRLTFPIRQTAPEDLNELMPGAPSTVLEALSAEQPYQHGDHISPLLVVHELNRIDKHRVLLPVAVAVRTASWSVPEDNPATDRHLSFEPLTDGAVVARFAFAKPIADPNLRFAVQLRLEPDIDEEARVPIGYLRRGDLPNWALGVGVHYVSRVVDRLEKLL
jgi:hypothetical protein